MCKTDESNNIITILCKGDGVEGINYIDVDDIKVFDCIFKKEGGVSRLSVITEDGNGKDQEYEIIGVSLLKDHRQRDLIQRITECARKANRTLILKVCDFNGLGDGVQAIYSEFSRRQDGDFLVFCRDANWLDDSESLTISVAGEVIECVPYDMTGSQGWHSGKRGARDKIDNEELIQ